MEFSRCLRWGGMTPFFSHTHSVGSTEQDTVATFYRCGWFFWPSDLEKSTCKSSLHITCRLNTPCLCNQLMTPVNLDLGFSHLWLTHLAHVGSLFSVHSPFASSVTSSLPSYNSPVSQIRKAKFHYASWFEAGSKLVADRFEAKFHYAIWFEPSSNQLRTSSEPTSVMEFGFYHHNTAGSFCKPRLAPNRLC